MAGAEAHGKYLFLPHVWCQGPNVLLVHCPVISVVSFYNLPLIIPVSDVFVGLFLLSVVSAVIPHGVLFPCLFGYVSQMSEQMLLQSGSTPRLSSHQWEGKKVPKRVQPCTSRHNSELVQVTFGGQSFIK